MNSALIFICLQSGPICLLHPWGLPMSAKLYCLYYFCWLKNIPLPDGYGRALGR